MSDRTRAAEFERLRKTLDEAKECYIRWVPRNQAESNYPPLDLEHPYLETHLQYMLTGSPQRGAQVCARRSGGQHTLIKKKNKDDYRLSFPTTIQVELGLLAKRKPSENTWVSQNITATWVVCYLNGIFPDQTKHGWQNMECCSHRCAFNRQAAPGPSVMGWVCVEPTCLVWESKAANQSRGNDFCTRQCVHADCWQTVCECQGIHNPPCL